MLSLPPALTFGAGISDPKETLANVKKQPSSASVKEGSHSLEKDQQEQLHTARDDRTSAMLMAVGILGLGGLFTGLGHWGLRHAEQKLERLTAQGEADLKTLESAKAQIQHHQRDISTGYLFFPCLMIFALVRAGLEHAEVRRMMRKAKDFNAGELTIKAPSDPATQQVCVLLNKRINQACEIYATQFHTLYREKPAAREHLNKVFGGADGLPKAQDLRQLFEYIAYHKVVSEHGLTGWQSPPPISEKEHLEKLYILLRTGLVLGDPFQFLADKPETPFNQGFNEELLGQVMLCELEVQEETRQLAQLAEKKLEIEKHLAFAQKALTVASLSVVDRKEDIQQIEAALTVFTQYQAQIEAVLSQPLTKEMTQPKTHETLLAGVDDSLQETMLQLKATLLTHTEEQAFQTSLQQALGG